MFLRTGEGWRLPAKAFRTANLGKTASSVKAAFRSCCPEMNFNGTREGSGKVSTRAASIGIHMLHNPTSTIHLTRSILASLPDGACECEGLCAQLVPVGVD